MDDKHNIQITFSLHIKKVENRVENPVISRDSEMPN